MKLCLALSLIASASTFSPAPAFFRPSTELFTTRDSSKEVQEALEISKKFGETSPEARAAWDVVEEMDASNSHHKPAPEPIVSTATFEIPSEQTDSSEQRKQALEDATRITEEYMKQEPAAAPQKVAATFETPSEQREQALADAKRITEEKGVTSPEAALAWELVEELDATAAHHRTTGQG